MAESSPLLRRVCNHWTVPFIARRNVDHQPLTLFEDQLLDAPKSPHWVHIFSKAIVFLWFTLATLAAVVVALSISFVTYPFQLALGIRLYRNPNYDLSTWLRRIVVAPLVLSSMEISLLSFQLFNAYLEGSVAALHLSPLKWWQYFKNVLILAFMIAEGLRLKFYTRHLDGWLEIMPPRTTKFGTLDEVEKGLSFPEVLDEKELAEKLEEHAAMVKKFQEDVESLECILDRDLSYQEEAHDEKEGITLTWTAFVADAAETTYLLDVNSLAHWEDG